MYTKTSLPQYATKEMTAVRRYNDFAWLREQLVEFHCGIIVPPVPEKSIKGTVEKVASKVEKASVVKVDPLLEYRQRALRKFLIRVGAHQALREDVTLQAFLEMDEEQWARYMKSPPQRIGEQRELQLSTGQKFGSSW